MMTAFKMTVSVVALATLAACGGGGGGSSAPTVPAPSQITAPVLQPTPTSGPSATVQVPASAPVVSSPSGLNLPTTTRIPDPVFRLALQSMGVHFNAEDADTADLLAMTSLTINRDGCPPQTQCTNTYSTGTASLISDLTGIDSFRNLTQLKIENQNVAKVDLHNLTALKFLSLWQEPITSIVLDNNTQLETLGLSETAMQTVDISHLTALVEVDFQQDSNQTVPYTTSNGVHVTGFSTLDFSNQPNLSRAYVYANGLTALNITANAQLKELWADHNHLATVDFSNNHLVNYVILNNNNLTTLDIRGIANNGVPYRLYTNGNPALTQMTVTNSNLAIINGRFASGNQGYFKDSTTTVVGN